MRNASLARDVLGARGDSQAFAAEVDMLRVAGDSHQLLFGRVQSR
jgi:hypothetical protein